MNDIQLIFHSILQLIFQLIFQLILSLSSISLKLLPNKYILSSRYNSALLLPVWFLCSFCVMFKNYLFNSLIQFIQRETAFSNINTLEKVQMFWNYFYSNGCMKNKPWEAFIIRNGNWETVMFENEEILYGLLNKIDLI